MEQGILLVFTGEGSHQIMANDVGTMGRNGLKPIIFDLYNEGYRLVNEALRVEVGARLPFSLFSRQFVQDHSTVARYIHYSQNS